MKNKRRILVTGGSGFIGSELVKQLLQDEDNLLLNVDCLTYASTADALGEIEENNNYSFEKVDIAHKGMIEKVLLDFQPTHIFNVAAETHVDNSISAPQRFIESNIIGTFNLLECVKKLNKEGSNFKKYLQVSTDEVYGSLGDTGYFTESTAYRPNSPYSASKASADLLVNAWAKTFQIPTVVTHCSNNFGPYQNAEKLIPKVVTNALKQCSIPVYGNGQNIREWIYVKDHVRAIVKLGFSDFEGEHFNIGGNVEFKNIDLIYMICDMVDEILQREYGKSQKSRSYIDFVTDRPAHDFRYALDTKKLTDLLDWKLEFDFKSALSETITWYVQKYMKVT